MHAPLFPHPFRRRGAAFGLAGLVKGLGIMAMKNYNIMDSLKTAVEDKKEANARCGGEQ